MLTVINPNTKTHSLLEAFEQGQTVTKTSALTQFGIRNLSAEVSRIRQSGRAIYANRKQTGKGEQVTVYRMGKPSRELIAAGYRALAQGI